jgi:aminomethyltransferase
MSAPLLHTPLHALHLRTGRAHGALRRLRDAGAVPGRPDGRAPHCRERGGAVRRLAHGPAALVGADAAAALETLVPVDVVDLASAAALRLLHQRQRRPARRPDGHAPPPTPASATCSWSSTPAARTPTRAPASRTSATAAQVVPLPDRALLALQGPKAVTALARLNPGVAALVLHDRRRLHAGRRRLLRHPLGLHRRGRLRDLGARRPGRGAGRGAAGPARGASPPAWARATRCAWKPACACTATTSTPHQPRSRPA